LLYMRDHTPDPVLPPDQVVGRDGRLHLDVLAFLTQRPEPFAPGEVLFWDHPHISERMLEAHLDPEREAASRPHVVIEAEVDWLAGRLGLHPGDPVLDLGCGPGLYCQRFARRGFDVTGIDISRRSIAYARESALEHGLPIDYRHGSYLELQESAAYAAVFLIYGDLCVLPDDERETLLRQIACALRPGGYFALDVTTPVVLQHDPPGRRWSIDSGGFWRPGQYLLLSERFIYAEESLTLDQHTVVEESGSVAVYRLWQRHYTPDSFRAVLERHGFEVVDILGDLRGTAYDPDSEWLAIIARAG
jgi:SAM-dependent methyltransferase